MRIDEIIKYLELKQYQDLNIHYLETQLMKYDKYIYDKEVI